MSDRDRVLASPALDARYRTYLRFLEADEADAWLLCRLRSDPALNQHLNAPPTDIDSQRAWLRSYKERESGGREYYFAIMCEAAARGVVRMYDFMEIDGKQSFAWGSWIIAPPPIPGLATYSAIMIYEVGFRALGFAQAHFDVRRANLKVIRFHERAGARRSHQTAEDMFFTFPAAAFLAFEEASRRQIDAHRCRVMA